MTKTEKRIENNIHIITPHTNSQEGNLFSLKSSIEKCLTKEEERIVIDLTNMSARDDSFLSAVISLLTGYPKKGGDIRIVANHNLLHKISIKTDLSKFIKIFGSVNEAIGSYHSKDKIDVLLVDDDEDEYVLMKDLLSEIPTNKYNLTWEPSYNKALESIKTGDYDICFIDYLLGEKSGLELLREIGDQDPELPCVILTGMGNYFVDMGAMSAGAVDYIEKGEVSASLLDRSIRYAIKGKQLEAKLRFQATHDTLTPLYNRRYFMDQFNNVLQTTLRYQTKLALCITDLDNFKDINDTYGHNTGDEVLLYFAESIIANLRINDVAGRFGGDEFSIFFPHTGSEQAIMSIERVREEMQNKEFCTENGDKFSITATFGLADISPKTDNVKLLLEVADKSLYKAKESGRNMIVINGIPHKK